jgi:hypothetical protein
VYVVLEDDLKGVGMDEHPLGNNWAPVALVEADSMEVGFEVEMKSALEDSRQVGSVDRKVERMKIGKTD